MAGELDGGLPILRDGILVGLIPCPDLEYALDRLDGEESALCLMSTQDRWQGPGRGVIPALGDSVDALRSPNGDEEETQPLTSSPHASVS